MNIKSQKKIFTKKTLLLSYFILFILLNIVDFFNLLSGDLDFFKKILSWVLIGYIFYYVSLSKLTIGTRVKWYDISILLAFSFMTIVKSIGLYVFAFTSEGTLQEFFPLFYPILQLFEFYEVNLIIHISFIIGVISTLIMSFFLYKNYAITKESFLGSFKVSKFFEFINAKFIMLVFYNFFIGLIVFNYFMEWFALSVDAIILVAGLIYYLVTYFHKHTKIDTSFLSKISNTGNIFFQNLIVLFSHKNTFLIGASFLLTLHLVVDFGVFIIPYSIGTENSLYFGTQEAKELHEPIFSFFLFNENYPESKFGQDISQAFSQGIVKGILFSFFSFLFHTSTLLLFSILLLLPMYIFYKNVNKQKVKFSQRQSFIILSLLLSYIFLLIFSSFSVPLKLSLSSISGVLGIDIISSQILTKSSGILDMGIVLIITSVISFGVYKITKHFPHEISKVIKLISVIFFVFYIGVFSYNIIENEIKLQQQLEPVNKKITVNTNYAEIHQRYLQEKLNSQPQRPLSHTSEEISLRFIPFIDPKTNNSLFKITIVNANKFNEVFIRASIKTIHSTQLLDTGKFITEKGKVYEGIVLEDQESNLFLNLGKGKFTYDSQGNIEDPEEFLNDFFYEAFPKQLKEEKFTSISFKEEISTFSNKLDKNLELIRFFFQMVFYLFGTIAFVHFFMRYNILYKN